MLHKRFLIIVLISISGLFLFFPLFDWLEFYYYDHLIEKGYQDRGSEKGVVILDIDEKSVKKLGSFKGWNRALYSDLITKIEKKKPKVLGFDILFLDRNRGDSTLISSFSKLPIVTGYEFTNPDPYNFIYPDSTFNYDHRLIKRSLDFTIDGVSKREILNFGAEDIQLNSKSSGHLMIDQDRDGVTRKVPLFVQYLDRLYPSFSLSLVLESLGAQLSDIHFENDCVAIETKDQKITIPVDNQLRYTIPYSGTWKTFRTISFSDVMSKYIGRKTFKEKVLIVGTSKQGLYDLRTIPGGYRIPGVEIHANIINGILNQKWITFNDRVYDIIISIFIIILISSIIYFTKSSILSIIFIGLSLIGFLYIGDYIFENHLHYITHIRLLLISIITIFTTYISKYIYEKRDKSFITDTFGKFIPDVVAEQLLHNKTEISLGGIKKEISMMFVDIKNFSGTSEDMDPEQLVYYLNLFLGRMSLIVKSNYGTMDKYLGDGFVALFGAPLDSNHAYLASKCSFEIVDEVKKMRSELIGTPFSDLGVCIGVNSGEVTIGNIGSNELFDYTAIGKNMNLASRIESLNRYYDTSILIGERTNTLLNKQFATVKVDRIAVKGHNTPVEIYQLLKEKSDDYILFEEGINRYISGDFDGAIKILSKSDTPHSRIMIERIELIKGSDLVWDGYYRYDKK